MIMKAVFSAVALQAFALFVPPAAMAQTPETSQPWCGVVDGDLECVYGTLQECEQWMQPEGQECTPNPGGDQTDD